MMKRRSLTWILTTALCASVVAVVMGADDQNGPQYALPDRALVYPMTSVVTLTPQANTGDPIGLLDSTSGAVYRLRGNRANSSARVYWQLAIPPVERTSGILVLMDVGPEVDFVRGHPTQPATHPEVQRHRASTIRDGETFLVDVVTGDTWLFRQRSDTNLEVGSWQPIEIFGYGKGHRTYSELQAKR